MISVQLIQFVFMWSTLLSLFTTTHAASISSKNAVENEMNVFVDRVLENVKKYIAASGLEPLPLPDQITSITYKDPLGTSWNIEASLRDGRARGLLTLVRDGNVNVEISEQFLKVTGNVGFPQMQFAYLFGTRFVAIPGPQASVLVLADGVHLGFQFSFNLVTLNATLDASSISNIGDMDVSIFGLSPVLDLMTEMLGNLVLDICKSQIINIVEPLFTSIVRDMLKNITSVPGTLPLIPTLLPVIPTLPPLIPTLPPLIPTLPPLIPPLVPQLP